MTTLTEIKKDILQLLQSNTAFYGVDVFEEFAGARKEPMVRPLVVVGIDKVEQSLAGLGGYLGLEGDLVHRGSLATITLRFDCHVKEGTPQTCHQLFEEICQILLDAPLGISKVWCLPLERAKNGFGTNLTAKAELQTCVTSASTPPRVSGFILKRGERNE